MLDAQAKVSAVANALRLIFVMVWVLFMVYSAHGRLIVELFIELRKSESILQTIRVETGFPFRVSAVTHWVLDKRLCWSNSERPRDLLEHHQFAHAVRLCRVRALP